MLKWEWSAIQLLASFFSSQNPLHQRGSVCLPEETPQQLRDELNLGSLKEPREGVQVRKALSQLGSVQQTRKVKKKKIYNEFGENFILVVEEKMRRVQQLLCQLQPSQAGLPSVVVSQLLSEYAPVCSDSH